MGNDNMGGLPEVAPAATAEAAATAAPSQDKSNGGELPVLDPGNVLNSGKQIIYTVDMALQAPSAAKAIDDIGAKAVSLGGYISNSSFSGDGDNASGSIVVRIPPDKLKQFSEQLRASYETLRSNMGSQDVTDQYVDTQSRLTNAEAQETQLLAIMKQAVKIDDILKVRQELDAVQQEIEQLKGQIRLMDNQVGYSTVSISVSQPTPPPPPPEVKENEGVVTRWGLDYTWQSIQKGFSNSLNFTLNAISQIFIILSYLIIPMVVIGVVVLVILLIVKLASKGKKG
jgi:hypothetical protein